MLDYEASGPTSRVYFSQRLRLHYVDWGNPGAPPLILLHGGRDHCRNWDWVASRLRHEWHVIAPDLRGHGDSQWSTDGYYNMPGYIYDLAQLIHQQQLAPATIVAHSLGGNIALRYAGVFPQNVSKLVAIEGLGPSPKVLAERGVNPNEDGTYSWKFDNYVRVWPPYDLTQAELEELWARIACPTLLVYGKESWASNPAEDGRAAHFQNAQVVLFEKAGHWVHDAQLGAFLDTVSKFLVRP